MEEKSNLARIFGEVLRQQRFLANELSQVRLAKKSGITVRHISRLENGQRAPNLHTLLDLAKGLGITPAKLMTKLSQAIKNQA